MPFEDCDCEKTAIYINVFSHFYAVSFLTALIAISSARLLSSSPIKLRKNHWLDFLKGTKLLIIIFQYWLTTFIVRSNWNLNMYFTPESTKCDKKNIITYSCHTTGANCAPVIQFPIMSMAVFPLMSLAQGQFLQGKAVSVCDQLKTQWSQNFTPSSQVPVTKGILLKYFTIEVWFMVWFFCSVASSFCQSHYSWEKVNFESEGPQ